MICFELQMTGMALFGFEKKMRFSYFEKCCTAVYEIDR